MSETRILLVDDDKSLLTTLKDALEFTHKYKVHTVSESKLALDAAKAFHPDIIILDVMMPDMDGAEVAAEMREEENMKDIPIIFQTAVLSKEEAANRKSHKEHYLAKPVEFEELVQLIDELSTEQPK